MSKLSSYISKVARNMYIKDVLESVGKALGTTKIDLLNIQSSIVFNSTIEEIREWETWLNLVKMESWELQDRIDRVVYTLNFMGFFTKEFLKEQALIFTNGEIQINERFGDYHFEIEFTSMIGQPPNIENFSRMVNINKPAKLTWSFKFRYRTHEELKPFPHEELKKITHAELRSKGELNA